MKLLGEIALLTSLVTSGYAAFAALWPGRSERGSSARIATASAVTCLVALTVALIVLAWALAARDFSFDYVARYSSRLLPWQFRLSAIWVGQAGSLLLWAWMSGAMAIALGCLPAADCTLRRSAFGLMMGMVFFLCGVMAAAANPVAASLGTPHDGQGLSPLLQHPSMLIHPPIVFMAYSAWAAPCALALAALWHGRLDAAWVQMARPWSIIAWTLLGAGLLLGAHWAYQELGWGGYWGWDPVENGSLLPWLTGTAFIHSLLVWRHRGGLKKAAVSLAIITFGLCNFATFLTRSGIFSSVHAFSESPIGWMFLALMAALLVGGAALIGRRRHLLRSEQGIGSLFSRESFILVAVFLLLSLAAVVMFGTLIDPVSKALGGRSVQVGTTFYNRVLAPVGLGLLAVTAAVPLLQWGGPPTGKRRRLLTLCLAISLGIAALVAALGLRQPIAVVVAGMAALSATTLPAAGWYEVWRRESGGRWQTLLTSLRDGRRKYAAYSIHLGFVAVAIGVAGSSLGTDRREITMDEGSAYQWGEWHIRHVRLEQRELPDKLVAEAVLEVRRGDAEPAELRPARHFHLLQREWTTEAAIHSTWRGDFYTVLHAGLGEGRVALTLVNNPLMRWIWVGGMLSAVSAGVSLLPERRRRRAAAPLCEAAASRTARSTVKNRSAA